MKCYSSEDILGEPQSQRMRQGRRQIAACRILKQRCSRDRERAKHEISKQRTVLDIGWLSAAKTADRLIAPPVNILLSPSVNYVVNNHADARKTRQNSCGDWRPARTLCAKSWDRNRKLVTLSGWEDRANVLLAIKVHDIKFVSPAEEFHREVYDWNLFGSLAFTWRLPGFEVIW